MTEEERERLSALMDDQLDEAMSQLMLDRLKRDEHARAHWARYHLIGDVIGERSPDFSVMDLSTRVSRALDDEPTIIAPVRRGWRHHLMKQVVGVAAVASIATVAVLGLRSMTPESPLNGAKQMASAQQPTASEQTYRRVSGTRWSTDQAEVEQRLNAYLVDHSEYARGNGVHGALDYRRLAGYGGE